MRLHCYLIKIIVDGDSFIDAFLFCIVAVINVGNAFLFLPFSYQRN